MNIQLNHDELAAVPHVADEATLLLHAEQVNISRRAVETCSVAVSVQTTERVHDVPVELATETVEVTHVAINRAIDVAPEIRHEGDTTIIPVVEEVLVIEKRLMLREEIHVTRVRTSHTHSHAITLREQSAIITRTPLAGGNPPPSTGVIPTTPQQDG